MKKIFTFLLTLFVINSFGEIPPGYYDSATETGYTLKTQLYNIIKDHTSVSYTPGIWDAFYTTDDRADGFVWDPYSTCDFTFGDDQDNGTEPDNECTFYNREHSFPREWFGGAIAPMNTDLFHIYPTSKTVNSSRASLPYGETNGSVVSSNGCKVGSSSYPGYTENVFEPIDEYKGDFARSYFYMVTRYENLISSWPGSDMLDGSNDRCFTDWALSMLIEWHTNDPVSQKEIDRNDAIYEIQDNRNPYIDHPEYVLAVFDPSSAGIVNLNEKFNILVYPNPVLNELNVKIPETYIIEIYSIIGEKMITTKNTQINTLDWKPGIYFVLVKNEVGLTIKSEKIIKK